MTGQELSNLTHSERPWLEARENTPIGEKSTAIISKDVMQDYYGAFSKTPLLMCDFTVFETSFIMLS